MPTAGAGLDDARAVADAVQEMFISGELDRVYLMKEHGLA